MYEYYVNEGKNNFRGHTTAYDIDNMRKERRGEEEMKSSKSVMVGLICLDVPLISIAGK